MVRSNMRRTALIPSFGGSTKNRSSLEASLGFTAITGTPRIENGGTFAVDFADGRRNRHNFYVRPDAPQQLAYTASHPAPLNRSATISTRTAVSIARPQNDGMAEAGSNEAKSVSCHSGPERGFQPDRAGLGVLQGWRRSELLASQVLYEGVTHDPVPTFDGSQLLRNSSYVSKKAIRVIAQRARAGLVRIVHDNARRAGNRGKSKRRLKTTLVWG